MGAAALAVRLPGRPRARSRAATCGLALAETPGPLVAVCGLVGGSGASTLALALARQAARESADAVLLTEPAGPRAGLAAVAGHSGDTSLAALARDAHDGRPPPRPFVEIEPRLRLVAAGPCQEEPAIPEAMSSVLAHARDAHPLVVVDCGTSWAGERAVLDHATHLVWTVPATAAAVDAARAMLGSRLMPPLAHRPEALFATAVLRRPSASVRALRRLAAERCERLILSPFEPALTLADSSDHYPLRSLSALAAFLQRA